MSHWRHFRLEEFVCKHCGAGPMSFDFITRLDVLRGIVGFPLSITSGYRCPEHDKSIGGAGVHPLGCAADIPVAGARQDQLVRAAINMGFQGIGINARGDWPGRFVHLDDLQTSDTHPRPRIWSY